LKFPKKGLKDVPSEKNAVRFTKLEMRRRGLRR